MTYNALQNTELYINKTNIIKETFCVFKDKHQP